MSTRVYRSLVNVAVHVNLGNFSLATFTNITCITIWTIDFIYNVMLMTFLYSILDVEMSSQTSCFKSYSHVCFRLNIFHIPSHLSGNLFSFLTRVWKGDLKVGFVLYFFCNFFSFDSLNDLFIGHVQRTFGQLVLESY